MTIKEIIVTIKEIKSGVMMLTFDFVDNLVMGMCFKNPRSDVKCLIIGHFLNTQ